MPSVDVAMARSLQGGAWERLKDSLARSVVSDLVRRDVISDAGDKVTDVKTAFSSWDNCMAASFCKYPVIAVMVVGGLIILAIVICIVRCACCAKACCCSCFHCLKCCGNCCGCCDPPGARKHKYLDEPYIPPHQGYRTEAPMHATFPPAVAPATTGVTPQQYAEFDVGKKGGEDSLPQMPSWEGAGSKKVEVEQEAVEMNNLNKTPTGTTEQKPSMGRASPGPNSPMPMEKPHDPYGRSTPGPGGLSPGPGGMRGTAAPPRDPYASNPYDSQADGFGLDQSYDIPPAGMAAAAVPGGRNSPAPERNSPAPGRSGYGRYRMEPGYAEMPSAPGEYGSRDPYGQTPSSPAPPMGATAMGTAAGYGTRRQGPGEDPYGSPRVASPGPARMGSPGPGNMGYGMRPDRAGNSSPGPGGMGYGMRPDRAGNSSPGPGNMGYGMRPDRAGNSSPGPSNMGYGMRPDRTGNSSPAPAPYGMEPRMRNSPGPRSSPRPPGDAYRSPRQTPVSANGPGGFAPPPNRSYSPVPPPDRQYAQSPRPLNTRGGPTSPLAQKEDPPSSPIVNNSGFDFTSGFSRPLTAGDTDYDRRPSESRESHGQEGYPGFKPYRPPQEGWSGV